MASVEMEPTLIAEFLRAIPSHRSAPATLGDICGRTSLDPAVCELVGAAVLASLDPLDLLEVSLDGAGARLLRARSEAAYYLARSWAALLDSGARLLGDWHRVGLSEGPWSLAEIFRGTQFTYISESRRLDVDSAALPLRRTSVSQVVVKARVRGLRGDRYLVRYDGPARAFQLVGGHARGEEETPEETMRRELLEELPGLRVETGREALFVLGAQAVTEISRTCGALTEYVISLFQLSPGNHSIVLSPAERWVTEKELVAGRTREGRAINARGLAALAERLPAGLRGIPRSFMSAQRPRLPELIRDRRLEIVSIAVGLIGIVASFLLAA